VAKKSALAPYFELADHLEIAISGIEPCSSATANCFAYHIRPENREIVWDWLYGLHKGESVELPQKIEIPKHLIPAFGLALKGLISPAVGLNFLPADRRKKQGKTAYYTMFILIALALLSGVGWGASRAIHYRMSQKELALQIQKFSKEVGEVDRIRTEAEIIGEKISYLNRLQNTHPSVLDMLAEMSKKIPDTAWIQQFTVSDKGLQIEGTADSASELVPILEASPLFKDVGFLSGITKEREGKERFLMGLKPE
jgi:general secretion pathway protein L